jgi:hypothetical protein
VNSLRDRTYFKHHAFIILGCHPVSQCRARMRVWNSLFTKGLGQLKGTKNRENIPCRLVNPREAEHSATLSWGNSQNQRLDKLISRWDPVVSSCFLLVI